MKHRLDSPARMLALFFGAGMSPVAPGTIGTLAAIPLYWLMTLAGPTFYAGLTVLVIVAGSWVCGRAADEMGSHDHPSIVLDEVAGYLVTMMWLPVSWQTVILGFIVFRFFDIVKPWPIRWVDRKIEGGVGIMADDVLAGVAANVVLWLVLGWVL